ncbi:LINE-1 retrotransposable element ORF1 protein [Labeo rohita]|uniref:LINE-1 retrotransposable element ORF1 protein n=1 Tax=Labeo rohita TaxID=84645 RepID=A0ABQ8LTP8_LABRO|nr:LINE-1 retrotransposable element ORF1 protein [Labeo rohita]
MKTLRKNQEMQEKLTNIELRSRRNNVRIYGILEGKEDGSSVAQFVDGLLKNELGLDIDLQIQRAHRALLPKPNPNSPPQSIIVNFLQFTVKETVLKLAWQK